MSRRVLALAFLFALPTSLPAQAERASTRMANAIAAYQNLDFDLAAILLRRALSGELSDTQRVAALMYLGAAEHYRARPDSAAAVFGRLVLLAPRYQPDTLIFPPEITRLYKSVHDRTAAVLRRLQTPPRVGLAMTDTVSTDTVSQALPTPPLSAPSAESTAPATKPAQTESDLREPSQRGITATGGGSLVNVHATSEAGGQPPARGTVLGLTASVRYRRFELGMRYMEGSLQIRDLVEGAAALRFATTPWLTLQTGPQIRRYETPAGAERWVTWLVGARAEAPIIGTSVRGHALGWLGPILSVNVASGSGTTRGGELGVTIDATGPLWFGVTYGIDQASVRESSRRETVQMLNMSVGLRRRS